MMKPWVFHFDVDWASDFCLRFHNGDDDMSFTPPRPRPCGWTQRQPHCGCQKSSSKKVMINLGTKWDFVSQIINDNENLMAILIPNFWLVFIPVHCWLMHNTSPFQPVLDQTCVFWSSSHRPVLCADQQRAIASMPPMWIIA